MATTHATGSNFVGDGLLIGAATLAEALASEDPPVVLDVRWSLAGPPGIDAYREGHVPGAVFVDLDTDLSGEPGPGGVRGGRPVVVYDEADSSSAAARAWWVLRYFGHTGVAVLDGGYRAWLVAGGAAEKGDGPHVAPGDFTARPGQLPVLDAEGAGRLAGHGVLLDARAAPRYAGDVEPVDPVAGHIPGAVSAPTVGNVAADGHFLPAQRLRRRFAGLGVPGAAGTPVGAYCGSGVTAAHEVLALAVAGVPAALYVGSWSEWVADPSRPVATGGSPG
jgi:thiosulfate/3-mercaptopyruvate sulfurtransferase